MRLTWRTQNFVLVDHLLLNIFIMVSISKKNQVLTKTHSFQDIICM